ncbi:MAG: NAD-binding protein, partial [Novosphingobium sp.]
GVGAASPADNGYQGGFASALMLKDLKLAMDAAEASGARVPLGRHATEIYEAFNEAGNGARDFGAIFTTL